VPLSSCNGVYIHRQRQRNGRELDVCLGRVSGGLSTTPFLHKQEHHVTVGSICLDRISLGSRVGFSKPWEGWFSRTKNRSINW
jgi:hypothetical protein